MESNAMNKHRVYLKGWYGLYNLGDDLILISILSFTNKNFPDLQLFVDRKLKSYMQLIRHGRIFHEEINFMYSPKEQNKLDTIFNFVMCLINRKRKLLPFLVDLSIVFVMLLWITCNVLKVIVVKLHLYSNERIEFYKSIDIIHFIGGGYFNGRWFDYLIKELVELVFMKLINPKIRIIATGQTIGPFYSKIQTTIAKRLLFFFDFIYVREKYSFEFMKKVEYTNCLVLGDDAVLLWKKLLDYQSIPDKKSKKCIGFNIKDFPDYNLGYPEKSKGINNLLESFLNNGYKINIFLFGQSPGPDDYAITRKNLSNNFLENTFIFNPYKDFRFYLREFSKSELNYGFAYHFVVLSLMFNIPVFGLFAGDYYNQKVRGALELYDLESFAISMGDIHKIPCSKNGSYERKKHSITIKNRQLYESMLVSYRRAYQGLLEMKR